MDPAVSGGGFGGAAGRGRGSLPEVAAAIDRLAAETGESSLLDALLALSGAAEVQQRVEVAALLEEDRWQPCCQVSTAHGVRASVSMPLGRSGSTPRGPVNLYARDPQALSGKEEALAGVAADFARTGTPSR